MEPFEMDIRNTCRICLSTDKKLFSLFSTQVVDGYLKKMPDLVKSTIDVNLTDHELLPRKICDACISAIIQFYTYKEKCKRNENILQFNVLRMSSREKNYMEFPSEFLLTNDIEHEEFLEENSESDSIKEDDLIAKLEFKTEEELFLEDELLEYPEEQNVNQTESSQIVSSVKELLIEPLLNENCNLFDQDHEGMETNISPIQQDKGKKVQRSIKPEGQGSVTVPVTQIKFSCKLCTNKYETQQIYLKHCRVKHYLCEICFKVFQNDEKLWNHVDATHHSQDKTFKFFCVYCEKPVECTLEKYKYHMFVHDALSLILDEWEYPKCEKCKLLFLTSREFIDHRNNFEHTSVDETIEETLSESLIYKCTYCHCRYETELDLKVHIFLHSSLFPCPYNACGCQYETYSRLSTHIMQKHIYQTEFMCLHCNEIKKSFDELQEHSKTMCSARKFSCSVCDKKFLSEKALQQHERAHVDGKKFVCSFCGKRFSQAGELTIHKRSHTGERPYVCNICRKAYKTSSMRASHMDTHIEGKTFVCNICSTKLQTRTSYRNHMRRHTVEKQYLCINCDKKFHTKFHLQLHTTKIHGEI